MWLDFRSRRWTSPRNRAVFEGITRHWAEVLGSMRIDQVGPLDVQRLYMHIDNGKRSGSWLDRSRHDLHAFFSWAIGLRLCAENPVTREAWPHLGRRKKSKRSRVYQQITPDLLERILDLSPVRYHRFLAFLYLVGLRSAEALAARWGWIHDDPSVLVVPDNEIKQRRGYTVPLGTHARRVLGDRGSPGELLFPEVSLTGLRKLLQRIGRKLGVRIGTHQLRRSCATGLVNAGLPVPAVCRAMGWRTPPQEWFRTLSDSYYLGVEGGRVRGIQDTLLPE